MSAASRASSDFVLAQRYQIVRTLGSGAQSTVYLAYDRVLEQWRALKVAAAGTDPELLARFQREARLVARLSHPNIVRVLDVIDVVSSPAIVMEFVPGGALSAWLRLFGPVPAALALDIALQCASALEHAHELGIMHRDVKPANVLIQLDGDVALADFGIARCENDCALTADGAMLGTLSYMSPEQRNSERVDARSDIYSLGAMLYTITTGRRDSELFLSVEHPSRMSDPHPSVAEIVKLCCRFLPSDRIGAMSDLRDRLARLQRPTLPPAVPRLASCALPVPQNPPFRTEDDPQVARLRIRVSVDQDRERDPTETVRSTRVLPYVMPPVGPASNETPDYLAGVPKPAPLPAPPLPPAPPPAPARRPWPRFIGAAVAVLVALFPAVLMHQRARAVTEARSELVVVVEREQQLLQALASAGADPERLAAAWHALEDGGGPEEAARVAEEIVAERRRLPDGVAARAARVQSALDQWKRAESCGVLCGWLP